MSTEETRSQTPEHPAASDAPAVAVQPPKKKRRWLLPVLILLVVIALIFGLPKVIRAFNTVSTDDAYVNSYVTFVAPRVAGQVARVLVDDNRVKKGDILVELDPEPYQVAVSIKQSAVDAAQAAVAVAEANVRSEIGQVRSERFKLTTAI